MKFYIIAGEASGDMHGANLMRELKKQDPGSEFRFWGGDRMQEVGGTPVKHIRELAFMGFTEVLMNLRTILGNIRKCKQDILNYKPDAVILIDYPGFNMRIAEFLHDTDIKILYYISPQIWAWKQNRVYKIRKFVDRMFVILPFEKEFYARFDMEVDFVGHPLLDEIAKYKATPTDFRNDHNLDDRPIIALLPGSRTQEIKVKLPIMLSVIPDFPEYQFVVAGAPSQDREFYESIIGELPASVVYGKTYNLLNNSHSALVTSGTATLETALFGVPEVVCYKGGAISYQLAKRLIRVKYISLVNLVMDKPVVKELIQGDLTRKNLVHELKRINSGGERSRMLETYRDLKEILGGSGASENTANLMLKTLRGE